MAQSSDTCFAWQLQCFFFFLQYWNCLCILKNCGVTYKSLDSLEIYWSPFMGWCSEGSWWLLCPWVADTPPAQHLPTFCVQRWNLIPNLSSVPGFMVLWNCDHHSKDVYLDYYQNITYVIYLVFRKKFKYFKFKYISLKHI